MLDPQLTTKTAEVVAPHLTWFHMVFAVAVAGLTGGFFNPVWKFVLKKIGRGKTKDEKSAIVQVAEIRKDEHTEANLWTRVENLEKRLQQESERRDECEKGQGKLQFQIDELKRERLFTLSRYIHLKLRIEEAKREIEYLKSKLREKDPEFDKDYPNFSVESDSLSDEHLIDEIIRDTPSAGESS
jgi:hypothetical protein